MDENEGKVPPGEAFADPIFVLPKDKNFSLEKAGAGPARPCKNKVKWN